MKAPARYIQSLRIVNAQRLLERTKYSIGEVSEIVGYDNPLYFSRVFKKETGLSPGAVPQSGAGRRTAVRPAGRGRQYPQYRQKPQFIV